MGQQKNIRQIIQSDWFLGALLLAVFLLTNGYTYGWDDQHLEIPLLKSFINPNLYPGDYYVQGLKLNVTSFFYPLLSKFISIDQIPAAYLALYIISRYFLFLFSYKIWRLITKQRLTAFCCTASLILVGRVEEFLYRTFSHQEFTLAFIMAGLYYFYKERFLVASFILGMAANFHALYSLFPMSYLIFYLLTNLRTHSIKILGKSIGSFVIAAIPVISWILWKLTAHDPAGDQTIYQNWQALYQIACPQNFIFQDIPLNKLFQDFKTFFQATNHYLLLFTLFIVNIAHNATFRKDRKTQAVLITASLFLGISFILTYLYPVRLILDLNLVRNTQYMYFILMGYTTYTIIEHTQKSKLINGVILILLFILLDPSKFASHVPILSGISILAFLALVKSFTSPAGAQRNLILGVGGMTLVISVLVILKSMSQVSWTIFNKISLIVIPFSLLTILLLQFVPAIRKKEAGFQKWLILIPILVLLANYTYYHYRILKIINSGPGFWQMQRNWEDMQRYVKNQTPENAMLMVPYDMEMGGFRIQSERTIICSYRDCGIIGFNYKAAVEWQKRIKDIETFKVYIESDFTPALLKAMGQYKVNYIVFMRYAQPQDNPILKKIYENDVFSLYQVMIVNRGTAP